MSDKDSFEEVKNIIKELTVGDKEKKNIEVILKKVKEGNELNSEDKQCLRDVTSDSRYVRKLSEHSIDFSNKLQDRTSIGFLIVLGMYVVAFAVGVTLIIFSLYFASKTDNPNLYLATFFGIAGMGDLAFLLYKPAQKIQESRGNASQLLAAFMEWQFTSIWSGKLFGKLYTEFDSCDDKNGIFEKMITLLNLKVDLTNKLVKTMMDATKSEDVKNNILKVIINTKQEKVELNSKVELEVNVYGISASDAEKITYLWTDESSKITINNKDKRKADFTHDKVGEFTIKVDVKAGDKHGSAIKKIEIKPKITAKAEPNETEKDKEVKLIATVEGLDEGAAKTLSYKWEEVGGTDNTITNKDKSEASIKPTNSGNFKFKVIITKDQKEFAVEEVKIKIT